MLNIKNLELEFDELQQHRWPPVGDFSAYGKDLESFLDSPPEARESFLRNLRATPESHGKFIQESLSLIYGYVFGYEDSPLYLRADDAMEAKLLQAKIAIEREMLDHWLKPAPVPAGFDQESAVEYLRGLASENTGIYHRFFEYVKYGISRASMEEFLKLEAIRNEVVDDEVAFIVIGMQGLMKKTMVSNLWDECGNGKLSGFHTYWLRRLLDRLDSFGSLPEYRDSEAPWFAKITSNSFNMMATRPGYKYRAYGSFLITESWVEAHFERILAGIGRTGLDHRDATVYFTSHVGIDPFHTEEMLQALLHQQPPLTPEEVAEVVMGAHTAVAAGTHLYEHALRYFTAKDADVNPLKH
jgi:hypothetical protein